MENTEDVRSPQNRSGLLLRVRDRTMQALGKRLENVIRPEKSASGRDAVRTSVPPKCPMITLLIMNTLLIRAADACPEGGLSGACSTTMCRGRASRLDEPGAAQG